MWLLIKLRIRQGCLECGLVLCKLNCTTLLTGSQPLTCSTATLELKQGQPVPVRGVNGASWTNRSGGSYPEGGKIDSTESGQNGSPTPTWDLRLALWCPPYLLNIFLSRLSPVHEPCVWIWMKKCSSAFFRLVGIICYPSFKIEIHPLPRDMKLLIAAVNQQSVLLASRDKYPGEQLCKQDGW